MSSHFVILTLRRALFFCPHFSRLKRAHSSHSSVFTVEYLRGRFFCVRGVSPPFPEKHACSVTLTHIHMHTPTHLRHVFGLKTTKRETLTFDLLPNPETCYCSSHCFLIVSLLNGLLCVQNGLWAFFFFLTEQSQELNTNVHFF